MSHLLYLFYTTFPYMVWPVHSQNLIRDLHTLGALYFLVKLVEFHCDYCIVRYKILLIFHKFY